MSEESHELSALENAWTRFATYDHNAAQVQRRFYRLRSAVLVVGLAATVLAIVYQYVESSSALPSTLRPEIDDWRFYFWLAMISMPILGSVLAAGASRFARGVEWVSLRGAAEAVKREVYRYRCQTGVYSAASTEPGTRDEKLAAAVGQVTVRLMDTDIINGSLSPYRGKQLPPKYGTAAGDDGFSDLTPAQYLDWRLTDQLSFFRGKSEAIDRKNRLYQWGIYGLGGAGTLLAALGHELWVPVSAGLATVLISYLALRNVETQLAGYNRAALELDNVATWWSGLPEAAKADPTNFGTVVDRTETVLGSENASWVQEMQKAMETLAEQDSN